MFHGIKAAVLIVICIAIRFDLSHFHHLSMIVFLHYKKEISTNKKIKKIKRKSFFVKSNHFNHFLG
jgi:hypothetical protein